MLVAASVFCYCKAADMNGALTHGPDNVNFLPCFLWFLASCILWFLAFIQALNPSFEVSIRPNVMIKVLDQFVITIQFREHFLDIFGNQLLQFFSYVTQGGFGDVLLLE